MHLLLIEGQMCTLEWMFLEENAMVVVDIIQIRSELFGCVYDILIC